MLFSKEFIDNNFKSEEQIIKETSSKTKESFSA
jgi:hypothetical protein